MASSKKLYQTENIVKESKKLNIKNMHRNGVVLTIACIMLCLTFNYTFPLHRENSKWNISPPRNDSQQCPFKKHHDNIVDRTKKMTAHIENALKIMKDTSDVNENRKTNKQPKFPNTKNVDEDLSHFEQMVIQKKNPYLDLKELELKYYNSKNARQSVNLGSNFEKDPSLREPFDEGINVEITNRGLSGFAIPTKLMKGISVAEDKFKTKDSSGDTGVKTIAKISKKQTAIPNHNFQLLETLDDDIRKFEERKIYV